MDFPSGFFVAYPLAQDNFAIIVLFYMVKFNKVRVSRVFISITACHFSIFVLL